MRLDRAARCSAGPAPAARRRAAAGWAGWSGARQRRPRGREPHRPLRPPAGRASARRQRRRPRRLARARAPAAAPAASVANAGSLESGVCTRYAVAQASAENKTRAGARVVAGVGLPRVRHVGRCCNAVGCHNASDAAVGKTTRACCFYISARCGLRRASCRRPSQSKPAENGAWILKGGGGPLSR